MTPMMLLLVSTGIAILVFAAQFYLFREPTEVAAISTLQVKPRHAIAGITPARKPQAPPQAVSVEPPDLVLLEWDFDATGKPVAPSEPEASSTAQAPATPGEPDPSDMSPTRGVEPAARDALRQKLRDRYIAARFSGMAKSSSDLDDAGRVIKGVRLYFEEDKLDRADEFLEMAIAQASDPKPLRLARLELAFLRRDAVQFTEFARDFRRCHPDCPEWLEVSRLGRALAPTETRLFGNAQGARAHDNYGPWPDMPNWLQASWDLTAEVLRADFHREMAFEPAVPVPSSQRNAA